MKVTADQKRLIFKEYLRQGHNKEHVKALLHYASPDHLEAILRCVRLGQKLPVGDPRGAGKDLLVQKLGATGESKAYLMETKTEVLAAPQANEPKTVLFSFKIGTTDLQSLRRLSEREGETVSVLIRQAVRAYLSSRGAHRR